MPEFNERHRGLIAASGALLTAALSSACCWLPLLAIALGASSAGLGAFFEAWRLPFLGSTVVMLGVAFYLAYRGQPDQGACATDTCCDAPSRDVPSRYVPSGKLRRFNRATLWITTLAVTAFALFPEYVGAMSEDAASRPQVGDLAKETSAAKVVLRYRVEGMSCAGCEAHAREALQALPDVISATVSYAEGAAQVTWRDSPRHDAVAEALAEFGYRARPMQPLGSLPE